RSQAASSLDWSSMAVPLRSGCVEAEVFEIGEGFNAVARTLASEAGLFCPAERDRRAGDLHAVDRDHAVVERAVHPELERDVLGDEIGDEAVFGGVGAGEGVLFRVERGHGGYWAECLLEHDQG